MIDSARLKTLNDKPIAGDGRYVLYWMQQAQRTVDNHALEYAIEQANKLDLPLLVCFGLMDDYPEANERHYAFLLEGLDDVDQGLNKRNIKFVIRHGQAFDAALHYGKEAALIVCDRGYLRHQRQWRDRVADGAACRVVQVESDVVVPVEVASDKHESAARTIRPKIHKLWQDYLKPLRHGSVKHSSLRLNASGDHLTLDRLKLDRSVKPVDRFKGGEVEAGRRLRTFIKQKLSAYAEARNDPVQDGSSELSPYLHYGHISPLTMALAGQHNATFLEELIVRRELSMNFVNFESKYDQFDCVPDWARKSLHKHRGDKRAYVYTREQLEAGQTHDPYWNAAQREMADSGFMHNYMRMYWGKKILEWTKDPEEAFDRTLRINNKFEMDGRDANSFANIAWVFGLHDRPWGPERPIFGLVRYMNDKGLERKFDIDAYVAKWGGKPR